ncbi:MAG: DUF421 domain-containing protein, partial [Clostridia bacterium]
MQLADLGQVVLLSVTSLVTLFILTKLMGNRQMSQLTVFDYIVGISIGSLAAEMATHPDPESWLALVAMVIYAGASMIINTLNNKSLKLRKVFLGEPLVLYDRGT